jgi:selenide,water dikinase
MPDDAAVYRLNDQQALVFTTDFFTPIVDDPYQYGAIAAANALSDIYAMGATPLLALNIAAFPADLPTEMLTQILRGSAEKVREANAVVAGGHTIQDKEPKVGLAVVGLGHPDRLLTKSGARPGDILVLTKPLGTGCITTAGKNDKARPEHLAEAVRWMSSLNRAGAEAATAAGCRTATDITGFGFLGHASEIAEASRVTLHFHYSSVPFLPGVDGYAEQWTFPGGSAANMSAYQDSVMFEEGLTSEERMLLFDAQTSGGLLLAVPPANMGAFEAAMTERAAPWWRIGEVEEKSSSAIVVTRN